MRVVSGKARGTPLVAVEGDTTRPILDRVKTALFDTIRNEIQDASILDLFAGSGSVGIEALSQGARHCTFLDLAPNAITAINSNLNKTKLQSQAMVRKVDAFAFLRRSQEKFDLIFVAPPQYKQIWIEAMRQIAERPELVNEEGSIIVQIDPKEYESLQLANFSEAKRRVYGNTELIFYKKTGSSA